ncbi:hypothetical protein ACFWP0_23610 [Achromobacter sp. NPDC058515]|uniref:hypothetical protein n=1 Tax=Achromobacter sp. NPDC058515 TaxID=3346533 RepID=UPI0036524CDA
MSAISWLERTKEAFSATGCDCADLYELLKAAIVRKQTDFPAFLYEASGGHGLSVGEGYFYCLDQDWDGSPKFNGVVFFLGEVEASAISVRDYVLLMGMAADIYSRCCPDDKDRVLSSFNRLKI